ncbi:hypothetical protein AWENTII_011183 [Aspergillus wentii]|nr:hypothetical protein MW887_003698 [Aspergillus wentii]
MLGLLGVTAESTSRRNKLMSLWTDDGASESLHESWKTSRLYGALEKMLSNSDPPSSSQTSGKRSREEHEDISALDGEWGFRVDRTSTPLGPDAPRVVEPSVSPRTKRARLALPTDSQAVSHPNNPLNSLRLPPQTSQLLDAYFAITHSWFPIVAKHNILRASYLYANAPLSVASVSPGSGDHAALWAILSYTISQSQGYPRDGPSGLLSKTREYYSIARKLIPPEQERYELGHLQSLLLLSLVNIGLGDFTAAWLLSSQAVHMAVAMDLSTVTDTRRSEELRQGKAVFLGCFVIDSLLSFRLSRRPCMHPRDLTNVTLLEEDGLEEWNCWADVLPPMEATPGKNPPRRGPLLALSCFNRLVELASVVNKIARNASAGPKMQGFSQQLVLELKQWDGHLPLACRLIGPESIYPERHSALLPHQTYLGLTYTATLLWLYLRIAPQEIGLHHSQRPAIEGAKKLLYRALPVITQHLENFQMCGLPPIFELSLHTIAEQAFVLRNNIESDTFPFARWTEALLQRTSELSPVWPVYGSLTTDIERWYQSKDLPETSYLSFQQPMTDGNGFARGSSNGFPSDAMAMSTAGPQGLQGETPMHPQARRHMLANPANPDYSSILGISIPVDGQYMTPKDTAMENADLSMMDVSLQPPMDGTPTFMDKSTPTNRPKVAVPPTSHPQPPTPDSSVSNTMMSGTGPNDRSMTDNMMLNTSNPGENSPTGDIDTIFKDLAYLDTTEWANSREAGLRDFGFIDDNTFQAFCDDPDRLVGSQPLVHPTSIADIWPPPGFFPETFREPTENTMSG